MLKYDYAIIGAGPAGLASAAVLASGDKSVVIYDCGKDIKDRICPKSMGVTDTCECKRCAILYGVGGAGGKSDGKLLFSPYSGGMLYNLDPQTNTIDKLIFKVKKLYTALSGVANKPNNNNKKNAFGVRCLQSGLSFLAYDEKHIGSDLMIPTIEKFKSYLEEIGVIFKLNWLVRENNKKLEAYKIGPKTTRKDYVALHEIANKIVLAVGRSGNSFINHLVSKKMVSAEHKPIDIGLRIETVNDITKPITDIQYDFKIKSRYKDFIVRSYCVNPQGYVVGEHHNGFNLVNGHAESARKSKNCNFAVLFKAELTQPVTNTTEYGRNIARVYNYLGQGQPIVQRLQDIYDGRRSTTNRITRSNVIPTLSSAVPGDHAWAMPGVIMNAIIDYLHKLDKVMPGISNGYNTLLYGPEIKFQAIDLELNEDFSSKLDDSLYFIGDCSGKTGSIVSASVMGMLFSKRQLGGI